MNMTNLQDLVEIVRASRQRTADVFPLPDVPDCIDFAITEAAEYLDAEKRENPTYKRNRDKGHDKRKELGQCGYMIASALMQPDGVRIFEPYVDWKDGNYNCDPSIHGVIYQLVAEKFGSVPNYYLLLSLFEWRELCIFCNYKPAELLREACAAFEAKHLPVAV